MISWSYLHVCFAASSCLACVPVRFAASLRGALLSVQELSGDGQAVEESGGDDCVFFFS